MNFPQRPSMRRTIIASLLVPVLTGCGGGHDGSPDLSTTSSGSSHQQAAAADLTKQVAHVAPDANQKTSTADSTRSPGTEKAPQQGQGSNGPASSQKNDNPPPSARNDEHTVASTEGNAGNDEHTVASTGGNNEPPPASTGGNNEPPPPPTSKKEHKHRESAVKLDAAEQKSPLKYRPFEQDGSRFAGVYFARQHARDTAGIDRRLTITVDEHGKVEAVLTGASNDKWMAFSGELIKGRLKDSKAYQAEQIWHSVPDTAAEILAMRSKNKADKLADNDHDKKEKTVEQTTMRKAALRNGVTKVVKDVKQVHPVKYAHARLPLSGQPEKVEQDKRILLDLEFTLDENGTTTVSAHYNEGLTNIPRFSAEKSGHLDLLDKNAQFRSTHVELELDEEKSSDVTPLTLVFRKSGQSKTPGTLTWQRDGTTYTAELSTTYVPGLYATKIVCVSDDGTSSNYLNGRVIVTGDATQRQLRLFAWKFRTSILIDASASVSRADN